MKGFRIGGASAVILCVGVFTAIASAVPADRACVLPTGLAKPISERYQGARVITISDLSEYYRKLFQKDHGTRCPGLVKVDFYGDGQPTWAIVLLSGDPQDGNTRLLVAHQVGNSWRINSLDTASKAAPVVWRERPGTYRDVYGEKTVRAVNEAIVFGEYESWAILYAWTGKDVKKIWIRD